MEREIEGIVLSLSDYREKDGLLTILAQDDRKIHMVAKGIRNITSKNAGALLVASQSRFIVRWKENKDLQMLQQAQISRYRQAIRTSLLKQAFSSFFCELMLKNEEINGGFQLLKDALDDLQENEDVYTCACVFVNQLCLSQGIAPWVDGCVNCGRSDHIVSLSLKQGGFVCTHCMNQIQEKIWTKKQLQRFRYLCHADFTRLDKLREYDRYNFEDFMIIFAFFREYSGIDVKGYAFIEQLAKMGVNK